MRSELAEKAVGGNSGVGRNTMRWYEYVKRMLEKRLAKKKSMKVVHQILQVE